MQINRQYLINPQRLTFDIQDQIGGGGVVDEAFRVDAPDLVVWHCGETNAASSHHHTSAMTQETLLQQLETSDV